MGFCPDEVGVGQPYFVQALELLEADREELLGLGSRERP